MTDLQWLAIGAPIGLVVFVCAIVFVEELVNQAEMKRENAEVSQKPGFASQGKMTVQFRQSELDQLPRQPAARTSSRAS